MCTMGEAQARLATHAIGILKSTRKRGALGENHLAPSASSGWDARAQGLGGWTISAHHIYDPRTATLYLGNGSSRRTAVIGNVLQASAGELGVFGNGGDDTINTGSGDLVTIGTPPQFIAKFGAVVFGNDINEVFIGGGYCPHRADIG